MLQKSVDVKWHSKRQRDVAVASGYRLVDGKVEVLAFRGDVEEGTAEAVIKAVRPASLAEQAMWDLLMQGEQAWTSSLR